MGHLFPRLWWVEPREAAGGPSSGAPMTSYSSMTGKVLIVCAFSSVPSWSGLNSGPLPSTTPPGTRECDLIWIVADVIKLRILR